MAPAPTWRLERRDRALPEVGPSGERLLAQVLASPADDGPRLVYADHLQQRGDPRGELIALQCRRAKLDPESDEAKTIAAREEELFARHLTAWIQPFMSDRSVVEIGGRKYTSARPTSFEFVRGFIEVATVPTTTFPAIARGLFAREPLRRLRLTNRGLSGVLKAYGLEQLRELDLSRMRLKDDARALFKCRRFECLEVLELGQCGLGVKGMKYLAMADPDDWPALRHLGLGENALRDAAMKELAKCPLLSQLRSLELSRDRFGLEGWTALLHSPHLTRLEVLDVNLSEAGPEGARPLTESKIAKSLRALRLRYVGLGDEGLATLTRGKFPALRELRLPFNQLSDLAVELLEACPWAEQLEILDLSENDPSWQPANHLSPKAQARLAARYGNRLVLEG